MKHPPASCWSLDPDSQSSDDQLGVGGMRVVAVTELNLGLISVIEYAWLSQILPALIHVPISPLIPSFDPFLPNLSFNLPPSPPPLYSRFPYPLSLLSALHHSLPPLPSHLIYQEWAAVN